MFVGKKNLQIYKEWIIMFVYTFKTELEVSRELSSVSRDTA